MLVAAAFSGFVMWHMGYSASGPLLAATPDSFVAEQLGRAAGDHRDDLHHMESDCNPCHHPGGGPGAVPIAPRNEKAIVPLTVDAREKEIEVEETVETPADRVDASRIPTLLTGLMLVGYLVIHFSAGGSLTLDIVNWSFLTLIMLLVRNPFELIALTKKAASNVGEILLQFPLYAGILGIMSGTGLITVISRGVRGDLHAGDLSAVRVLLRGAGQLLRPLRRRSDRRAGARSCWRPPSPWEPIRRWPSWLWPTGTSGPI